MAGAVLMLLVSTHGCTIAIISLGWYCTACLLESGAFVCLVGLLVVRVNVSMCSGDQGSASSLANFLPTVRCALDAPTAVPCLFSQGLRLLLMLFIEWVFSSHT